MASEKRNEALREMLEPAVNAVGMQLWGVEFISQGRHSTLRLYIDSAEGVTVEDCAAVSHQVSGVLDVEDPINSEYNLEVSSPGLDRPLFNFDQFACYVNENIRVRLKVAVAGKRNFTGTLISAKDDILQFDVAGELLDVAILQIDKANLIPRYDFD